ncbi:MAG TPA: metalloregulator ArsR/SmtB family transcription factor [Spirochaetota bacterium]|nr:metalloregulator ArsR/SmtB family transcription factor [Spirochaetota bacterium]
MKKDSRKPVDIKRMTRIFKALSNENRLELFLEILKVNETCFETECTECFITDIMETLSIGAPTVSHHMKELTGAGLVITERKGKFLTARINDELIRELSDIFYRDKS